MKKYFTKEVQIALVALTGIVVLFFGMKFLKGLTLFSTDNSYYVQFEDVSGVSASCPVYANGFRVGVVEDVIFNYDSQEKIVAVLGLDKKLRLPKGTKAEIASDLLGNVKLELKFGPNPVDLLTSGDTITGGMQLGALAKAADMIPQVEKMLPKLDSILASVNQLLADPAISSSLHNVDQITANLTTTSNELKHLTASLNRQMPEMMQKADGVLDNTNTLTKNLSDLDIAMTMTKVNNTLQNVEQMTAKLNSDEGTLGLLMRDQELYRNLTSTMSHTDSLMMDLKAHPKRYVHFSIFGKKDK
ncbi:MAG: MCE family protein [Prevotella sp.]|jgi:phospholipid/cholesterol/gamma-HCH transport system substrate-binding protein|nr:MCE family protein [Prevotella sp.]